MKDSRKVILLTGATGLLGNRVAEVSPSDCRLITIGRSPCIGLPANVEHLNLDLTDPNFGERLPTRVDSVIHLAQSRLFREFPRGAIDVFSVNTQSTALLLDHAVKSGCKEFIYASTGGVYKPSAVLTESSSVLGFEDMQVYQASKLAAEAMLGAYARTIRVVALRIFFMYGEGQQESMLIPRLIRSVRDSRPISLIGSEGFRLNPLYVGDAASLVWKITDSNFSGVLNVAGPQELTLKKIGELIGRRVGKAPLFETSSGVPLDFRVSLERLERNFGQMGTSFDMGVCSIT